MFSAIILSEILQWSLKIDNMIMLFLYRAPMNPSIENYPTLRNIH